MMFSQFTYNTSGFMEFAKFGTDEWTEIRIIEFHENKCGKITFNDNKPEIYRFKICSIF